MIVGLGMIVIQFRCVDIVFCHACDIRDNESTMVIGTEHFILHGIRELLL